MHIITLVQATILIGLACAGCCDSSFAAPRKRMRAISSAALAKITSSSSRSPANIDSALSQAFEFSQEQIKQAQEVREKLNESIADVVDEFESNPKPEVLIGGLKSRMTDSLFELFTRDARLNEQIRNYEKLSEDDRIEAISGIHESLADLVDLAYSIFLQGEQKRLLQKFIGNDRVLPILTRESPVSPASLYLLDLDSMAAVRLDLDSMAAVRIRGQRDSKRPEVATQSDVTFIVAAEAIKRIKSQERAGVLRFNVKLDPRVGDRMVELKGPVSFQIRDDGSVEVVLVEGMRVHYSHEITDIGSDAVNKITSGSPSRPPAITVKDLPEGLNSNARELALNFRKYAELAQKERPDIIGGIRSYEPNQLVRLDARSPEEINKQGGVFIPNPDKADSPPEQAIVLHCIPKSRGSSNVVSVSDDILGNLNLIGTNDLFKPHLFSGVDYIVLESGDKVTLDDDKKRLLRLYLKGAGRGNFDDGTWNNFGQIKTFGWFRYQYTNSSPVEGVSSIAVPGESEVIVPYFKPGKFRQINVEAPAQDPERYSITPGKWQVMPPVL